MRIYKVGVLGLGFIGKAHIDALRRVENVHIEALTDVADVSLEASRLNIPHVYRDYKKMIDECRLDAVHICTPNQTHYEIAMYAIEKGLHVVCEKPFMRTAEQAEAVCKAAEEKGIKNAINFHNRFYPAPHYLKNLMSRGELGDMISVHGGYVQDWLLYDTDFNWRVLAKNSGKTCIVGDIGSHWLDLVEFVTGNRITEVFAELNTVYLMRKAVRKNGGCEMIDVDTEDTAYILLRFANGAKGNAVVSAMLAGKKNKTSLIIGGKKMSAEWDSESINDLWLGRRNEGNTVITKDPNLMDDSTRDIIAYPGGHCEGFPDAFRQLFKQFYASVQSPDMPTDYATFRDGLRDMVLCEAVYESAQTSRWVKV